MEREKLRKAYVKKLSSTIEMAYEKDPRIVQFRESDKQRKQDQKDRKRQEKQRLVEEREAEERKRQAEIEAEKQRVAEEEKMQAQEKQKAKKQMQMARRRLRELVQEKQYFTEDSAKRLEIMEGLERVCMNASVDQLDEIVGKLTDVDDVTSALDLLSLKVCFTQSTDNLLVQLLTDQNH